MNTHKLTVAFAIACMAATTARAQFLPGKLAVLRAGDNGTNVVSILKNKNAPIFVDEFDPVIPTNISGTNTYTNGPMFSVAIPTNDPVSGPPAALFFNGQAGTEGNLARSGDHGSLAFAGYAGNIYASETLGTPSSGPDNRGICVIGADGATYLPYVGQLWYGTNVGKSNPRGVVSDNGTNNFWGSGNNFGNLWLNDNNGSITVTPFQNVNSTRSMNIINGILYTTLQAGDGGTLYPAGVYSFSTGSLSEDEIVFTPTALPESDFTEPNLVIPCAASYTSIEGFDISPDQTIAYTADINAGVQKYVRSGTSWRLACAFAIPGAPNPAVNVGCFGLAVDWTGTNYPVVFATTTDANGQGANIASNRLIRIDDNYGLNDGLLVTNPVTVLATAWSTNIAFRGLAFTPDRNPEITTNLVNRTVVSSSPATFIIGATTNYPNTYYWLTNGVVDPTMSTFSYNLASAQVSETFQVVVSNQFGSVTSLVANLTVDSGPVAPVITSVVTNLTNAFGDTIVIPVTVTGTEPLTYAWYILTNGVEVELSDTGDYTNTATDTLTINNASAGDAGSYYVVANNTSGTPASNLVATLTLVTLPPSLITQPSSTTTTLGGNASFSAQAFGSSLSYQWYQGTNPAYAMTDGVGGAADFTGSQTATLNVTSAQFTDASNYFLVVANGGGAVTSSVVSLAVIAVPPASYVAYTNLNQGYFQDFDSLPIPAGSTANTGNPVTITEDANKAAGTVAATLTYSLSDPFDFAFPVEPSGGVGGLGLSNTMSGWYGWAAVGSKLGASAGDQSTGGDVSFGAADATNRALGLLATSTTGATAFAVKLVNQSATNFNYIDLSYVGELWRDQPKTQTILFGFALDSAGTNAVFSAATTNAATWVPGMNVSFPGSTNGLQSLDGTNPVNQTNLVLTNQYVGNWVPGTALWLMWLAPDAAGGEQGMAIDNLSFSTPYLGPVIITQPQSQGAFEGGNVTNSVVASNAYSLGYQWETNNGSGTYAAIPDATNSKLVFNPVDYTNAGSYIVVVTNLYGSATSQVAVLTVSAAPTPVSITSPPVNQTNYVGGTTTFTVGVSPSSTQPLSYFWSFGAALITNATTASLVLTNLQFTNAGTYSVIVSNAAGAALPVSATLTVLPAPPVIYSTNQPVSLTVYAGGTAVFAVAPAGTPPFVFQWRSNNIPFADGNGFTGSATSALTNTGVQYSDAGSYSVVVTNSSGSVTSSIVTLTVLSTVAYTYPGMVYTQNFNSLPDPALASVNAAYPVTIPASGGISYAPSNPFDFAQPSTTGGLGLLSTMPGWYGSANLLAEMSATPGDSKGGSIVSYGPTNSVNAATNRALGLICTSTSGGGAFALRLLNISGETLTNINLSYNSELWRQTSAAKTITNFYYVDLTATNLFPTTNYFMTAGLTNLSWATTSGTYYGTNGPVSNSVVTFANQRIANWPQGAALWIVWAMTNTTGSSQGMGIDNLTFSATGAPVPVDLVIQQVTTNVMISWPQTAGPYTLQYNNSSPALPSAWQPLGLTPTVVNGSNTVTLPATNAVGGFFQLKQ
jgi:hypothetical protein